MLWRLEIIGAGFGRTGTNSLKLALEHLGFGPCHHMFEVRDNPEQFRTGRRRRVARRSIGMTPLTVIDRRSIGPARDTGASWRSISRGPKSVLTVRDPDAWFDSVQATVAPFLSARGTASFAACERHRRDGAPDCRSFRFSTTECQDRDHAIRVFKDHIDRSSVGNFFRPPPDFRPARRLGTASATFLESICRTIPFPMTNSSKQFGEKEWKQD